MQLKRLDLSLLVNLTLEEAQALQDLLDAYSRQDDVPDEIAPFVEELRMKLVEVLG